MEDCIERFDIDWELVDDLIQNVEGTNALELFDEDLQQGPELMIESSGSGETNNLIIRVVDILLQTVSDVDQQDMFGNTALHNELLLGGCPELVECLLDKHADVNAAGYFGYSPLQLAVLRDLPLDLITTLIRCGANVNHRDLSGQTALHMAARKVSDVDILQVLLHHGADVHAKDVRGQTPLHFVCHRCLGYRNMLLLFGYGASVSDQDADGQTPLHVAFRCDDIQMINFKHRSQMMISRLLLKHAGDAVVNSQDSRGRTPVHLAAFHYHPRLHNILRNILQYNKGSMSILDNDGKSPVDFAIENPRCLKVFTDYALKLKCANLLLDGNHVFDFSHSSTKHIKYLKELELMKLYKFGKYSLYDIFYNSQDPSYLKNKEIAEGMQTAVESPESEKQFPSYRYLLRDTFYKRQQRLLLLDEAQEVFPVVLPVEMKRLVLSHLSDQDLKNWITAQS